MRQTCEKSGTSGNRTGILYVHITKDTTLCDVCNGLEGNKKEPPGPDLSPGDVRGVLCPAGCLAASLAAMLWVPVALTPAQVVTRQCPMAPGASSPLLRTTELKTEQESHTLAPKKKRSNYF